RCDTTLYDTLGVASTRIAPTTRTGKRTAASVRMGNVNDAYFGSTTEGAVVPHATRKHYAIGRQQQQYPQSANSQGHPQVLPAVLSEHERRGKICQIRKRQEHHALTDDTLDARPPAEKIRQPVERQHVSREEIVDHHENKNERADFEKPERDQSDQGLHQ